MWTMWSGFIAVWTVGVFVHGVIRADEVRRPNVLLIVSEDNGLQFGCYGDKTVPTPHVDRLAASGVRFANAYVTQAVCSPSRSSILTGLYPHQNGQLGLATHRFTMVREWPTLPTLLHSAGYRTGLLGKLHVLPESAFQFDVRWADASAISFSQRDVHRTADQVRDFIQGSGEQPFFLMVNFADTHLPFLPQSHGVPSVPVRPEQVVTMPAVGVDTPRLRRETADYYSCVQRLDEGVGLVLSALEQSGQSDRTLVIFVGDHGPQFARGKVTCYELALKVPLVVRRPGAASAPQVRDELVSTVDLVPTILESAGVAAPANLAGRSLAPLLGAGAPAPPWRDVLFCEWNTSHAFPLPSLAFPQRSVRDARYKLIVNLLAGQRNPAEKYYTEQTLVKTGPSQAEIDAAAPEVQAAYATWRAAPAVELYDLRSDPYEWTNLADKPEFAAVRARLLTELDAWRRATQDPLLDADKLGAWLEEHRQQEGLGRATRPWRYPRYLYGVGAE